MNTVFKIII